MAKSQANQYDQSLESVQRLACIDIIGVLSTTPTEALNTILNLLSLSLLIIRQARISAYRLE